MINNERLRELFDLQIGNKATAAEQTELRSLVARPENEAQVKALFADLWERYSADGIVFSSEESETILKRIFEKGQIAEGKINADEARSLTREKVVELWPKFRIRSRIMAVITAAAAVAAIVIGVWFFNGNHYLDTSSSRTPGRDLLNDITPGKYGATITLANGKVIQLSDAKSGVVIGDRVSYSDGSAVRYSSGTSSSGSLKGSQNSTGPVGVRSLSLSDLQGADSKGQMLTAQTAKGQTYQFTLPDGTKVWLNADSKLMFPSNFVDSKTRNVKLSGEGYFEVAHNAQQPFRVESKEQRVEVLGTHFNINAYEDEIATTTTLLEGSVRVAAVNSVSGRENIMLKPNQQSILNSNGPQVLNVDVSTVVGWKNGLFTYKNTQLSIVMRQIERWYNVSVNYDNKSNNLKEQLLSGSVSRYDNVSGILKAIELTGAVKFKIKDKTITVYQQ